MKPKRVDGESSEICNALLNPYSPHVCRTHIYHIVEVEKVMDNIEEFKCKMVFERCRLAFLRKSFGVDQTPIILEV